MKRNLFLIAWIVLNVFLLVYTSEGLSQDYPNKAITVLVGFAAGGTTDLPARKLAEVAKKYLNNQPMVVENKVGGAGTVAATLLAQAKPDGYTISAFAYSSSVLIPHMRKIPYDTKKDFEYIMQFAEYPTTFAVRADHPANTWKEWIEWAKKNVDKATYGTAGPGSGAHVFMQEIFLIEKINPNHIPFGSGNEGTVALLGGHVSAVLDGSTVPHAKAGRLKALAVENPDGLSALPDIPSFRKLGYTEVRAPLWLGMAAPGKTPAPILKRLEEAFTRAAKEPEFLEFMKNMGMDIIIKDGAGFRKLVEDDYDYYGPIIKKLGLHAR